MARSGNVPGYLLVSEPQREKKKKQHFLPLDFIH